MFYKREPNYLVFHPHFFFKERVHTNSKSMFRNIKSS